MDALIARYLDGTMDESEADELLRAAAADPRLERELQAYEIMLTEAAKLPTAEPDPFFTEKVMDRIAEAARHTAPTASPPLRRPRRFALPAIRTLAIAASLAVLFLAGYRLGRTNFSDSLTTGNLALGDGAAMSSGVVMPVDLPGGVQGAGQHLQLVRFAAQPTHEGVRSIAVAGTFNNWDPAATPMLREGDGWVAYLLLPEDVHQYMFVENGDEWITDPAASRTLDDGFGNKNAVLDLML